MKELSKKQMKEPHKKQNNRPVIAILICMFAVTLFFPIKAYATGTGVDSTYVEFENMGDETCYGTLLSSSEWPTRGGTIDDVGRRLEPESMEYKVWQAFNEYQDPDGFYFQQEYWLCSETKRIDFVDSPYTFKILLYYPESGIFISSVVYQQYATNSYYTVDMSDVEIIEENNGRGILVADKTYDYSDEILTFVLTLAAAVIIGLGIACMFGLTDKKVFKAVCITDICIQAASLGVSCYVVYKYGFFSSFFSNAVCMCVSFVIGAVILSLILPRISQKKIHIWKCILYSFVYNFLANLATAILSASLMYCSDASIQEDMTAFMFSLSIAVFASFCLLPVLRFKNKKEILCIIITNVVMQTVINFIIYNVVTYDCENKEELKIIIAYFILEIIASLVEAFLYRLVMPHLRKDKVSIKTCVLYPLSTNMLDFIWLALPFIVVNFVRDF